MGDQLDGDSDDEFEDQEEDEAIEEDVQGQNDAQANEIDLDQSRLYIWNMVQGSVLKILLDAA